MSNKIKIKLLPIIMIITKFNKIILTKKMIKRMKTWFKKQENNYKKKLKNKKKKNNFKQDSKWLVKKIKKMRKDVLRNYKKN